MSKVKISICGDPYHVMVLKMMIRSIDNLEVIDDNPIAKKEVDIFYWIFGFPFFLLRNLSFWLKRKPLLIIHWIGSDVMALSLPKNLVERLDRLLIKFVEKAEFHRIINLAGSKWLVDELNSQGISAYYFPLTTLELGKLKDPQSVGKKTIDFLSYVSLGRFSFYGGQQIVRLARELPQFTFAVIMPDIIEPEKLPKLCVHNLHLYPRLSFGEMQDMYLMSKCFIRLTEHDGLSLSILEALYYRLQIIWTHDFPHVIHIENRDLCKLKQLMLDVMNTYDLNNEGHNYVVQNYSCETWRGNFQRLLKYIDTLS